jgi:hypothetical protein
MNNLLRKLNQILPGKQSDLLKPGGGNFPVLNPELGRLVFVVPH